MPTHYLVKWIYEICDTNKLKKHRATVAELVSASINANQILEGPEFESRLGTKNVDGLFGV